MAECDGFLAGVWVEVFDIVLDVGVGEYEKRGLWRQKSPLRGICLGDFGNFNFAVFLAVASFLVDALLGFVANNADFVTHDFGRFDFG